MSVGELLATVFLFQNTEVLSSVQLKRIGEHRYSHTGDTFLDPWMQKYWTWIVAKFPLWWAPNLMTLTGLACNIVTSLILVYYSFDAKQSIPSWALLLCALGLFIYQTLDACDGKQARRTNSSSPLGELFDHGCDAISTIFVSLSVCLATQLGVYSNWMFFQCVVATTLFYTAHWQTYVSGTLKFGKFDVTEAQFSIMIVLLISAVFGTEFWSNKVPFLFVDAKILLALFATAGATFTFYSYLITIFTGGIGKNGSTVAIPFLNAQLKILPLLLAISNEILIVCGAAKTILSGGVGKNGSTVAGTSVLSPFIPIALVVSLAFIIYQKSPSNLYENHPCLYIITFGIVSSKITNKLVVAHMSRSEMTYFDSVLTGPLMLFLNQYFNTFFNEYLVLWAALIFSVFNILIYSTKVCTQIAGYLKIRVFTIKPIPTSKLEKSGALNSSNDNTDCDCDSAILLNAEFEAEEIFEEKNQQQSMFSAITI